MGFDVFGLRAATVSAAVAAAVMLSGCLGASPRPGWASVTSPAGLSASLHQPANPGSVSFQRVREEVFLPKTTQDRFSDPGGGVDTLRVVREAETSLGPAQKDVSGELSARLASFKPIQYLGALVFLFGVASLAWPPARALVGSVTSAAAVAAAGLALVFLPTVVVGREGWILGLAGGGAGAWFLAHRHGKARGELAELRRRGTSVGR